MNTRDRRPIIPSRASLTVGSSRSQKGLFDIYDAVPESTGSLERVDDTSSAFLSRWRRDVEAFNQLKLINVESVKNWRQTL